MGIYNQQSSWDSNFVEFLQLIAELFSPGNEGKYNFDLDDWTYPDKIVFELAVPKCPNVANEKCVVQNKPEDDRYGSVKCGQLIYY